MPEARTYSPREMIETLIGFDTTSRDSNLALIDFVADYLAGHGIKADVVPSPDGRKANLYATIGPDRDGGIALSGHTDVVPVDGQDWDSDPFAVTEKDGKLFGRGTCDMKSFLAIALALVPEMTAKPLKKPVHFALSYDEEVGCLGVPGLISHITENLPLPEIVIVGEPTDMKVVNAHKGIAAFKTTVTGHEAHSSATNAGVNAVMIAAELIHFLSGLADELREAGDPSGRFEPPYSTLHVGTVRGGTALNIIPKSCSFMWEVRYLPGTSADAILDKLNAYCAEQVLPRMHAVAPDTGIVTERRVGPPPLFAEDGSPAETLVLKLAERNETEAVSYGTEAGIFQKAGMATVVCGPGSIMQAHKPNEFVTLDQIAKCEAFLRRLIGHLRAA